MTNHYYSLWMYVIICYIATVEHLKYVYTYIYNIYFCIFCLLTYEQIKIKENSKILTILINIIIL